MLPDIPWTASDGTSYRELLAFAGALLADIRAAVDAGLRDAHSVTLLAAQAADLRVVLRDLAQAELAVREIYSAGRRDRDRDARPRRRRLQLL